MQDNKMPVITNLIHQLGRTDRYHRAAIESHVKTLGVHRTQHVILMNIAKAEKPLSQGDIAKAFDVSPATIAVSLKKMENSGLIERIPNPDDARENIIRLTEKGTEMIEKTKLLFNKVDEAMFKGISEEEMVMLNNILEKTQQNLKDYLPDIEKMDKRRLPPASEERKKK